MTKHSINDKTEDTSLTPVNVNDIRNNQSGNKNETLLEREPVPDTPFWLIKENEEKLTISGIEIETKPKWHIFWGKYMLSTAMDKEMALHKIRSRDWDLQVILVSCIIEELERFKREQQDQLNSIKK